MQLSRSSPPGREARWEQVSVAATIVVVAAMLVVVWPARSALACTCDGDPNPQEALEVADAVFQGRVVSQRVVERYAEGGPATSELVFHVDEVWKGPAELRLVVRTHARTRPAATRSSAHVDI